MQPGGSSKVEAPKHWDQKKDGKADLNVISCLNTPQHFPQPSSGCTDFMFQFPVMNTNYYLFNQDFFLNFYILMIKPPFPWTLKASSGCC